MQKRIKKVVRPVSIILCVILVSFFLFRCSSNKKESQKAVKARSVGILTMGPFPLLDMILVDLKTSLEASEDPKIKTFVLNANFQQEILRKFSREMVAGPYEVLASLSTPATQMVVAENSGRKPVVFAFVSTPSEIGFKGPGTLPKVTGFVDTVPLKENLNLIEDFIGKNASIGYLVNDGEAPSRHTYMEMLKITEKTEISIKKIPISSQSEIRPSISPIIKNVDCLFFGPDSVASGAADLIVQIAVEKGKPVFCTDKASVERGCIACVAPDYAGLGRRAAEYIIRILKGESPDSLPVVDFEEYLTYINTDIAEKLNIEIPKEILDSAAVEKIRSIKKE